MISFQDTEGNSITVSGDFALSKKSISLFNGYIYSDVSINFNIDNNSVNRKTLQYNGPNSVDVLSTISRSFYRIRNGNILDKGLIIIQKEEEDKLTCYYITGNGGWINNINNLIGSLDYTGVLSKDYRTLISNTTVKSTASNTSGIIFPMVDWCYDLKKGNNTFLMPSSSVGIFDSSNDSKSSFNDFYPCIYLRSIVEEISKQLNIKFTGTVFNDGLYNTLIITPSNGEMKSIDGTVLRVGDIVDPSNFLPEISCLDLIKFIVSFFGCSCYYDNTANTLTINIIEKITKETALDWSQYYVSHQSEYKDQGKNNYLKFQDSDENDGNVFTYDKLHIIKYGWGNISTENPINKDNEIASFPFRTSEYGISKNNSYITNIPLVNLADDGDPIAYSVIANVSSGVSRFTVSVNNFITGEVIRITTTAGVDQGYFVVKAVAVGTIDVFWNFVATGTGTIRKQKVSYNDVGARILSVKPSTNFSDFSSSSSFSLYDSTNTTATTENSIPYAIFSKSVTSDGIDQWKNNLAIDNPDSTIGVFKDPTMKEVYFNKISNMIGNPKIRIKFRLPESVYQSFVFDQFIFVKSKDLNGYFMIDFIENYIDGNSIVEIPVYML